MKIIIFLVLCICGLYYSFNKFSNTKELINGNKCQTVKPLAEVAVKIEKPQFTFIPVFFNAIFQDDKYGLSVLIGDQILHRGSPSVYGWVTNVYANYIQSGTYILFDCQEDNNLIKKDNNNETFNNKKKGV